MEGTNDAINKDQQVLDWQKQLQKFHRPVNQHRYQRMRGHTEVPSNFSNSGRRHSLVEKTFIL